VITCCSFIHVVRSHDTCQADNKSNAEEQSNYDALPERKVQAQNYGDWDEHGAKIEEYIERSVDRDVDVLIDAMLWYE
jgi:hypothetical protein